MGNFMVGYTDNLRDWGEMMTVLPGNYFYELEMCAFVRWRPVAFAFHEWADTIIF